MASSLIVEHIVRVRCPACKKIIGSTENGFIEDEALLAAAREIKKCPFCGCDFTEEEKMVRQRDLREMDKLEKYLKDNNIAYERFDDEPETLEGNPRIFTKMERHQICVPSYYGGREWDAICHWGSYGATEGLLEIYGTISRFADDVEGYLTADDVIERIEEHERSSGV